MAEVEIPSYFLCPISLQIMRDPVTLPTGITYDRDSIERWIFSGKHNTCPVTKQSLPECELTPNHTLRRLIQAWCALNPSDGIERFPTPKPPIIRNRVKAANAGAVPVLIELLLDEPAKSVCELVLVVLAWVCGCAEGRSELVGHAAGIAIVSKKILRISEVASEGAVRILNSVAKFSATTAVLQEMLQIGVVSKLCLVLQFDCGMKTKEKAREILRLHSRVWKQSPCLPPQFLISYPSS